MNACDSLRRLVLPAVLGIGAAAAAAAPLDPTPEIVLDRAVTAMGGPSALAAVKEIRVVWMGTQDLWAVYQSRSAEKPAPERRQETWILDVPARRGALRSEGVQSDETPYMWRDTVLEKDGYTINLKTQRTIDRSTEDARAIWERWIWSIPQLALGELSRRRAELKWEGRSDFEGRAADIVTVTLENRGPVRVAFDAESGLLAGYAWEGPYIEGSTPFRFVFKPYRKVAGFGLFPSGFRFTIGERVFRDFDLFDARFAKVDGDPWLAPRARNAEPVLKIVKQKPVAEPVAPGVFVLRNVGGYNVLVAALGPCYAIVDAPASFSVSPPIPDKQPPPNLAKEVLTRAAEALPGKRLCWVIPTHHHGDHIGGAAALVRSSPEAKLVVAPGTRALGERLAGIGRVEVVGETPLTLGEGDERMEIYTVTGALHADEMLLVYFPARRITFEGDLSDYIFAAKRLRQLVDERGLAVDRMYAAHTSTSYVLTDLDEDDPSN
ncbi:MAG: MBL fold metallo-hydrolase [Thermoanaerobaculia bacterium]